MLSRLGQIPLRPLIGYRVVSVQVYAIPVRHLKYDHLPVPPPAKIQMKPPPGEKGHMKYERYWSRDARYKPQQHGDTWKRLYFHNFEHEYELWPLAVLFVISNLLVILISVILFNHIEVWLDRSQRTPPWDWSRIRNNYWTFPTIFYDPQGITHTRLYIMEQLQDEMLEAARKRGTRE